MRALSLFALLAAGLVVPGQPPLRVLFIGNSLTAFNNLPEMVESMAQQRGAGRIDTAAVTLANFSLEDHWNGGPARSAIGQGGWDVVVLQQGPSALPESQLSLREYVKRFDRLIRRAGARTAIYMVWPSRARSADMNGVIASYRNAARDVRATLLPVGLAWQLGWARDPDLPLYGEDGFHPSRLGSCLAALVIYEGLTGLTAEGMPAAIRDPSLTPDRLHLLQDVAHRAITTASQ